MAKGMYARCMGDRFISKIDPSKYVTFQTFGIFPTMGTFDTIQERNHKINDLEDIYKTEIEWENSPIGKTNGGAIYVIMTIDQDGNNRLFGRYLKQKTTDEPRGLWTQLKGYVNAGSMDNLQLFPVRPTDIMDTDEYLSSDKMYETLKCGLNRTLVGDLEPIRDIVIAAMDSIVNKTPFECDAKYAPLLCRTAGEYLGILAAYHNQCVGFENIIQEYDLDMSNTLWQFPQDSTQVLIDSRLKCADTIVEISSKAGQSSGASSTLTGLKAKITPAIRQKYPTVMTYFDAILNNSMFTGPQILCRALGLLSDEECDIAIKIVNDSILPWEHDDSPKYQKLKDWYDTQRAALLYEGEPKYTMMLACVKKGLTEANLNPNVSKCGMEILNDHNYVQVITHYKTLPNGNITLDYSVKQPTTTTGTFVMFGSKTYWGHGINGKIGFKIFQHA